MFGKIWSGDWHARVLERVQQRGFATVTQYTADRVGIPLVELAEELGLMISSPIRSRVCSSRRRFARDRYHICCGICSFASYVRPSRKAGGPLSMTRHAPRSPERSHAGRPCSRSTSTSRPPSLRDRTSWTQSFQTDGSPRALMTLLLFRSWIAVLGVFPSVKSHRSPRQAGVTSARPRRASPRP